MSDYPEKKVSVIVPIYNVKKYLPRCIESIIKQSYKNLEIILVDDGSTDGSEVVCDRYAQKDSRVKVIHQANGGVSTARNTGLDICTGDFICFVDSDDYIHADFVKYLYAKLIENDCDICMCNHIVTEEWNYKQDIDWEKKVNIYDKKQIFDMFYTDMHGSIIMLWNKIMKRECVSGIRFDDGYINEDEGTTFKFLYNAKKIAFSEEVLYFYYSRDESITGVPYTAKKIDILKAYENRISFYKEKGESDLLNRECMFYLSEILANYYKVYRILKDKKVLEDLRKKYSDTYKNVDKTNWSTGRKLLYAVCRRFPLLYGIIKQSLK